MQDKKILTLLKKSERNTLSSAELSLLSDSGIYCEHKPVTHDELIQQIKSAAQAVSLQKAAEGFLYSVSSGDMRYRTALSSLIWANALPQHDCQQGYNYGEYYYCNVCGAKFSSDNMTCLDMLSHSREHLIPSKNFMDICCAGYVLNDLVQFTKLPDVQHCDRDVYILNRIFGLAGEITSKNKATALLKLLRSEKELGLTEADVYSVMGVLSSCGVFDTPEHKSYADGFVPCTERMFEYETDIYYPLNFWRGKHGINYSAIGRFFSAEVCGRITADTAVTGEAHREELPKKPVKSAAQKYFTDNEHMIDLTDRERYYYGLSPIDPTWEKEVRYSTTHSLYKRNEIYFEGDVVKKLIYEEYNSISNIRGYIEADMDVPTNGRKFILPKTDKGRQQPLTPSLLQTPAYMQGQLHVNLGGRYSGASSFNSANDQQLPLPYEMLNSREDFKRYTENYIASCPEDYEEQLDNFRNSRRVTVKFRCGDIFRVQLTPTLYTYGLILAKVRELEKWDEIPPQHPIRSMMAQPIVYRQYAIVTDNPCMTADVLSQIPLLEMEIAQDNEILWNTYPIICRKKLTASDIDLGFGLYEADNTVVWGLSLHRFDDKSPDISENLNINTIYSGSDGAKVKAYSMGMAISVQRNDYKIGEIPLPETASEIWKRKIAEALGLSPDNACDEFAQRFGGITRKQFIQLAEERFS